MLTKVIYFYHQYLVYSTIRLIYFLRWK